MFRTLGGVCGRRERGQFAPEVVHGPGHQSGQPSRGGARELRGLAVGGGLAGVGPYIGVVPQPCGGRRTLGRSAGACHGDEGRGLRLGVVAAPARGLVGLPAQLSSTSASAANTGASSAARSSRRSAGTPAMVAAPGVPAGRNRSSRSRTLAITDSSPLAAVCGGCAPGTAAGPRGEGPTDRGTATRPVRA